MSRNGVRRIDVIALIGVSGSIGGVGRDGVGARYARRRKRVR